METVISEPMEVVQDSLPILNDQKLNNKLQNIIIIDNTEELLGSVTTFPKTSGIDGPAVRTSARVIHKLRMDSTPLPQPEKKETQNETPVNPPKTPSQSKPHPRSLWSNEERTFFFEALKEHGRDFEQISRFINSKMRRKSPSDQDYKTNENVRQHYYQIFQKASKYLRFSDDVKKHAQELYTLINYGEMKRKLVMSKEKTFLKFRELVYKGFVTIRWKGKNIKIKTPSCRALRKLNQLEGNTVDDIQLPQRIDVTFRPVNTKSWGYVQTLAQNPRVRIVSLPLQKRVASLFVTMQQKWQMQNSRIYEKYVNSCVQRHGPPKIGEEIASHAITDTAKLKKEEPMLCFMPPRDAVIHRPMVQLNELLSSFNICLNSYEERIGAKVRGESLCSDMSAHIKDLLKHPSKRMRFDSASEKEKHAKLKIEEQNSAKAKETEELGVAVIDYKSNDSVDNEIKKIEDDLEPTDEIKKEEQADDVPPALLIPTPHEELKLPPPKEEVKTQPPVVSASSTSKYKKKDQMMNGHGKNKEPFKPLIDEKVLKEIRKGWNLTTVGDLSIGDLYVCFGSDSKLVLEYEIIDAKECKPEAGAGAQECKFDNKKLGNKLKSLLSIAALMETANNSLVNGYLSSHPCDKNPTDSTHVEQPFKQPVPTCLAPRIKAQQARWRQRTIRPLGNGLISGLSGQHVVREVYQTPPTVESQAKQTQNETMIEKHDDVTKILEAKIQGFTDNDALNSFSDSSRATLGSLWDCFPSAGGLTRTKSISEGKKFSRRFGKQVLITIFINRVFVLNEAT